MSHGRLPPGGGCDGELHCWLLCPLQAQSTMFVPLPVPCPVASRQSPDWTPVIVALEFTFHCWLLWPWQSQMIGLVPLPVPLPSASRHLLPYTMSCLVVVYVHS